MRFRLIPVLSFVMQRGRCAQCGAVIPSAHLLIELAAAIIGGVSLALFVNSPQLVIATAVFLAISARTLKCSYAIALPIPLDPVLDSP